jgi:hypothetical protein
VQLNWLAITVTLAVYASAIATTKRGYSAPETMRKTYGRGRTAVKAKIASDLLLPELVDLVIEVNQRASRGGDLTSLLLQSTITETLDSAAYLPHLEKLSKLYSDLGSVDRLYQVAVKWARRKALVAAVFAVAVLPLVVRFALSLTTVPEWILLTSISASALLATVSAGLWIQEMGIRNQLSELCVEYE